MTTTQSALAEALEGLAGLVAYLRHVADDAHRAGASLQALQATYAGAKADRIREALADLGWDLVEEPAYPDVYPPGQWFA